MLLIPYGQNYPHLRKSIGSDLELFTLSVLIVSINVFNENGAPFSLKTLIGKSFWASPCGRF